MSFVVAWWVVKEIVVERGNYWNQAAWQERPGEAPARRENKTRTCSAQELTLTPSVCPELTDAVRHWRGLRPRKNQVAQAFLRRVPAMSFVVGALTRRGLLTCLGFLLDELPAMTRL